MDGKGLHMAHSQSKDEEMIQCVVCCSQMHPSAKKCVECSSYQDWRKHIAWSSTTLALIVAIFSSLTALLQVLYNDKKEYSQITPSIQSVNNGRIVLNIINTGQRPGTILSARMAIVTKDETEILEYKSALGAPSPKRLEFDYQNGQNGFIQSNHSARYQLKLPDGEKGFSDFYNYKADKKPGTVMIVLEHISFHGINKITYHRLIMPMLSRLNSFENLHKFNSIINKANEKYDRFINWLDKTSEERIKYLPNGDILEINLSNMNLIDEDLTDTAFLDYKSFNEYDVRKERKGLKKIRTLLTARKIILDGNQITSDLIWEIILSYQNLRQVSIVRTGIPEKQANEVRKKIKRFNKRLIQIISTVPSHVP